MYSVRTVAAAAAAAAATLALHEPCHSVKHSKFLGNRNFVRTLLTTGDIEGGRKEMGKERKKEKKK